MLKKSRLLFLVALSAISYALPFTTPSLWWLIFFFPLPIFYALCVTFSQTGVSSGKIKLSFWHGFIWGIIAYGIQLYPAYSGVASLASAPSLYPLLLVIGLAIYLSFYSGIWFWVMGYLSGYPSIRSHRPFGLRDALGRKPEKAVGVDRTNGREGTLSPLICWAVAGALYFHWIDAYCLFPLLRCEGYPFAHPIIPLTAHPALLFFLPVLGKPLFTFFIFVPAGLATLLFSQHKIFSNHKTRAGVILLLLCCTLAILFFSPDTISPDTVSPPTTSPLEPKAHPRAFQAYLDLSRITHLPLQVKGESCSLAELVSHKLRKIVRENPETQLIILPESALYTVLYSENSSPDCAKLWSAQYLGKPISLICGGFKKNKHDQVLNTCYLFHDGVLMHEHSKTHTVPCAEQMPAWLNTASLQSLFFSELAAITPAENRYAPLVIPNAGAFIPVICSELFFSQKISGHENLPLLALVNDARFESEVFRELMLKTAQVKAIEWQRDILYVSYGYGVWIGKDGGVWEI
jgi:apolipoprotein N-acyltransferase